MPTDYRLDRNTRVWVEQPVLNTADLVEYQEKLGKSLDGFNPAGPEKLNVTFMHFGEPRQLFLELVNAKKRIEYDRFVELLQPALHVAAGAVTSPVEIPMRDLAIFGPDLRPVLVARLFHGREWLQLREPALKALDAFLTSAGFAFPYKFIDRSRNLRFSSRDRYQPHVILGSVTPDTVITGINLPPVNLTLGPTRICGVAQ